LSDYYFFEEKKIEPDRAFTIYLSDLLTVDKKVKVILRKRFENLLLNYKSVLSIDYQIIFEKIIYLFKVENQKDREIIFSQIVTEFKRRKSAYCFYNIVTIYY